MMDRLLENNTVLKVVSVIVAIFIWFQAQPSTAHTISRPINSVAVGYATPNPHLTVLSISPSTVTVGITGPEGSVESSSAPSDVDAWVNLAKITGSGTYSLKVAASVPQGTSLVSVVPPRVKVIVARLGQKKVSVNVHMVGTPATGYELSGYTTNLQQATISGSVGALNQVRSVQGTVKLTHHNGDFIEQIILNPVNSHGKVVPKVEVNPASATVNTTIQKIPPQATLPVISQLTGQPAAGYSVSQISVYPSSVTVSGTSSSLKGLTHIYTIPVTVAGKTTSFTEVVPVTVPKGTTLVSSGEITVTVTITKNS